jgi:peptide/nickel transport system substrate-binding protein
MRHRVKRLAVICLPAALACATPADAQDLRIGLASEPTAIDPHFHNLAANNALRRHIFESLVGQDAQQRPQPELATSWRALDDTTWEFKLRPDVKFSNGMEFTARDVVYSICRVPTVENSPSSFAAATRAITAVYTSDPLTLIMRTAKPAPLLPVSLSTVGIISAEANGAADVRYGPSGCENFGTPPQAGDFNDPARAIGTGPFKLVDSTRGSHILLERNDAYWGEKPVWARVTFRPMPGAGPRVAALLAGDVDVIESPPIPDFNRIENAGFQIAEGPSNRIIYLQLDQYKDPGWKTPGVTGSDGKNPFLDRRVRQAVSKAINRRAIVDGVMGGHAVPAGELLPHPLFGATPGSPVETFDPDGARKLLADAGYPNGFEVILGTPNDRYIHDEQVAQAVARMLTRVGIRTNVDAMTASTFATRRNKFEFSMYLAGRAAESGEMSNALNALVVTLQPDKGLGGANRGRYSNKQVDELTIKAMATVDDAAREKMLREASKTAMRDYAVIPLHFEVAAWAFRKGLSYEPRADQHTLAMKVRQAGP